MEHTPTQFSAETRQANLQKREPFDILIVGGGITGAGIARDAAMRGYKTALIDKGDFASGTSSKSSRLVHGGVRYLEMFEFGLVFEASRERRVLWTIAPHLVKPLPFLFPVYKDAQWLRRYTFTINMGLWMYDALALFRNYKNHKMYSPRKVAEMMRGFDVRNINGGAYYYDGQVDDARLTLETLRAAHRHGAVLANYAQVDELLKENGRIVGVKAHDTLRGDIIEIRARVVVNATGPWTDTLLQLDDARAPKRMRPTKGIHLLVPREKIGGESAVAFTVPDGRLMFTIPWGKFTIIGTTDTDYAEDFDRVHADAADVEYVLQAANHAFPGATISRTDVVSTYAGLRPLVMQLGKSASKTSREHEIWASDSGLVTIAGGKLTTYRSMAEELVDRVAKTLRDEFGVVAKNPCATATTPLIEEQGAPPPLVLDADIMAHLVEAHGPEHGRVLQIAAREPKLAQRIVEDLPYIWAEVPYAIEQEMAMTLTDVLARRMHILTEASDNGIAAVPRVAEWFAKFHAWDKARVEKELRAYQQVVASTNAYKA